MTATTHNFHLGDILSITTGRLVSPRHMVGVHDILEFMEGSPLGDVGCGLAATECGPYLLRQHPQLGGPEMDAEVARLETHLAVQSRRGFEDRIVSQWLAELVTKFGETLPVEPIPADAHERIDPVAEAERMAPGKVIVVEKNEE